jgi:molecular chaperone IbpA
MGNDLSLGRISFGPLVPSTVGFDRLFNAFENLAHEKLPSHTFPPHNIVKESDNKYLVELAVAGFSQDEIDIEVVKGVLTITGKKVDKNDNRSYLHHGIGYRSFKKTVQMADTVRVNGASLEHGILTVELENIIPEESLPKRIPIVAKKQQLLQE